MECDTHVLVEEYIKDRREFNVAILKSKGKLIDSLVEGVYRDRMDRAGFHKQFLTFGVALYGLVILIQMLISVEVYVNMLKILPIAIVVHGLVLINTYFLLKGEKYYNENVGAE